MFDIAPSEFLLVAVVALVVIGPKDLPRAMRVLGYWVGRARGVARQFRAGFDEMVRESELAEMEKKWASENERIMREHSGEAADATPAVDPVTADEETVPTASDDEARPTVEPTPSSAEPTGAQDTAERAAAFARMRESRGGPVADNAPAMVEQPHVEPAPTAVTAPAADPAAS